ncbi:MAG: hypothetical protein WAQ25_03425 [Candidatus Saccharimonas sp.]
MAYKRSHSRPVQKTGNILRTCLIWFGMLTTIVAVALLMLGYISERVAWYMGAVTLLAYGMTLLDFDVDDDD